MMYKYMTYSVVAQQRRWLFECCRRQSLVTLSCSHSEFACSKRGGGVLPCSLRTFRCLTSQAGATFSSRQKPITNSPEELVADDMKDFYKDIQQDLWEGAGGGMFGADPGALVADTGASVADTGSSVAGTGASVADTGALVADTGTSVADPGTSVADTGASVADTGTSVAGTGALVADTGASVADTGASVAGVAGGTGAGVSKVYEIGSYYLLGDGKAFRPLVMLLIARAVNNNDRTTADQRRVAQICEMIHSASLIHDDVIDGSPTRRSRPTTDSIWGQRQAILAGDYILARASRSLARIGNVDVITLLSQVLEDLVSGEFMQLGTAAGGSPHSDRFNHYLKKTYKKTASLFANTAKAMSILSPEGTVNTHQAAYDYGLNIGMAFQIVDDILDLTSPQDVSGKPGGVDLTLGLATAPTLFAAQTYPELSSLIMRRFSQPGDVDRARHLVNKSSGISESYKLASTHAHQASRALASLTPGAPSRYTRALDTLLTTVMTRCK